MAGLTEILAIGNELLIGDVLDTNTQWLCRRVTGLGGRVARATMIPDERGVIAGALRDALGRGADVVFTTGGLGPTVDDLTLPAIAQALGRPMELEDRAEAGYVDDEALTEERRKMAVLPAGAAPLFNPVGAAPGVVLRESGATIICLPGVPAELKGIFEESLGPLLRELYGDGYYAERVIQVDCGDESALAPLVNAVAARHADVYVKSRAKAYGPNVRLKITLSARGESRRSVTALLDAASEDLLRRLDKRGIRVIEQEP